MPFKIMKRSTYDELQSHTRYLERTVNSLKEALQREEATLQRLREEYSHQQSAIEALNRRAEELEQLTINAQENEVTIFVKDDLVTLVPRIRWKPGVEEKLFELGYLSDATIADPSSKNFAIQLSLMDIAYDGLKQIIEQFSETVEDPE